MRNLSEVKRSALLQPVRCTSLKVWDEVITRPLPKSTENADSSQYIHYDRRERSPIGQNLAVGAKVGRAAGILCVVRQR